MEFAFGTVRGNVKEKFSLLSLEYCISQMDFDVNHCRESEVRTKIKKEHTWRGESIKSVLLF